VSTEPRGKDKVFGPFRFDPTNQCLWRGKQRLSVRPKAFAVLSTLLSHAGQLVTKEELFNAVWPDTCVSDGVLRFCLRELRKVLGDDAQAPRFIETVHRRGYRFIGKMTSQKSADTLAVHVQENNRDYERAIQELKQAAEQALLRSDYQDAILHLSKGLTVLKTVPILLSEPSKNSRCPLPSHISCAQPKVLQRRK
jgi:DNA-binding winged helix-turn-helix (wHTH) protein